MPLPTTLPLPVNLLVQGDLMVLGSKPSMARSDLVQDTTLHQIPLTSFRVWDALHTLLPSAGASDDLGLITGAFGTDVPSLQTGDVKTLTATRYARCLAKVPPEYQAGQPLAIRVHAGMKTNVAATSAQLICDVYKSGKEMLISGSNLNAGGNQSINNLVFADKDFNLTVSTLLPGDELDLRLGIATVDVATGAAVIGVIGNVEFVAATKG